MAEIQTVDGLDLAAEASRNGHQQEKSPPDLSNILTADDFDYESLITEDDEPVDNIASEKQQRLLTEPLYTSSDALPFPWPFLVMANVGLFYHPQQPAVVPDVLLSLGVQAADNWWAKRHRSYFVSQYGKLPEVVVEIVSNNEGGEDSGKWQLYAQIGIPYYVIFDPQGILSQDILRAYKRDDITQIYQQIPPAWFPEVGLGLRLWTGAFEGREEIWLRWCDEGGVVVPTGKEKAAQERQEKERAQEAEKLAQQKAAQLIAQLKALGIEPQLDD